MLFNFVSHYQNNFCCAYTCYDKLTSQLKFITENEIYMFPTCEINIYGIVREKYDIKLLLANRRPVINSSSNPPHRKGVLLADLPKVKIENRVNQDGFPSVSTKKPKRNSLDFYFNPPKRVKPNSQPVVINVKTQVKLNNDGRLVLEENITYEE